MRTEARGVHIAGKACKGPAVLSGNSKSLSSRSHSGAPAGHHSLSVDRPEVQAGSQTGCRHRLARCADCAAFAGLDESESVETGSSGSPCSSRQASLPLACSSRISSRPSGSSEGEGSMQKLGRLSMRQGESFTVALLEKLVLLSSSLRPGHAA